MQQNISKLFKKMKKIVFSFSVLAITAMFTLISCKKKEPNVAPEPDTELASSLDISWALLQITDIEQMVGFVCERNGPSPKFYVPISNTSATITINNDTLNKFAQIGFGITPCVDGRLRDGAIFANWDPGTNLNAKYYHDYKFVAILSLSAYKVDNFNVTTPGGLRIENLVAPANYSPSTTNLSWRYSGVLDFKDPIDSTRDMRVDFNLVKTLLNTSTPSVFPVSKLSPITWSLALVSYKGTLSGVTSRNVPFKYTIDDSNPLLRNFTCSPDKIYGVALSTTTLTAGRPEEYYPFTNGSASFTTAALYPRVIYYGPEIPVSNASAPCDNTGAIMIKGISYPLTFKKSYK